MTTATSPAMGTSTTALGGLGWPEPDDGSTTQPRSATTTAGPSRCGLGWPDDEREEDQ